MGRLYKLRNCGYAEIGDDIWFSNFFFNAMIKINKLSGKIQIIDKFPNCHIRQELVYSTVCYINKQLIFIPHNCREIVSYDIETEKFESIALDKKRVPEKYGLFRSYHLCGDYVYILPTLARCIVRYDIKRGNVKYFDFFLKRAMDALPETSICFGCAYEIVDGKLYIPFVDLNAVAVFNISSESLDIRYLQVIGGCTTIDYIGGFFYLASSRSPLIYRWDGKSREVESYSGFPEGFGVENGEIVFHYSWNAGGRIFFFPLLSNMIVSFDIESKEIKKEYYTEIPEEEPLITYLVQNSSKKEFLLVAAEENLCVLDYKAGKLQMNPYFEQNEWYNKKIISGFLQRYSYYDSFIESKKALEEYIEVLAGFDREERIGITNSCGKKIFNVLQDN